MNNMSPSDETNTVITAGQTGKIAELLTAALRKAGLQSGPTQQVLEHQGPQLIEAMVKVVRTFVEGVSNLITRIVKVNRTRTSSEAIKATGRAEYIDAEVVKTMPKGEGDEEKEIIFFKPDLSQRNGLISDDDLETEFEMRGLKPADAYSTAKVNEDDPEFADTHPNATHWKDGDGKWCYIAFFRWGGERRVGVGRSDFGWGGRWWFAGFRK